MGLPMNDPSFLEVKNVPAEEAFFHQFFVERAKRDEIKGVVRRSGDRKDRNDEEDEALDAVERAVDDVSFNIRKDLYSSFRRFIVSFFHQDFDWSDVDSEEEAFATELAEKLMESSGNGKANFDDEDPDMDDWSDFGSDNDEEQDFEQENENANVAENLEHEDAFMDVESSGDEDHQLMTDNYVDDSGSDSLEEFGMLVGSDDDESSDEEGMGDVKMHSKQQSSNGQKRKKTEMSIYADAEEYEKVIKKR